MNTACLRSPNQQDLLCAGLSRARSPATVPSDAATGTFRTDTFANPLGSRDFKLYVPSTYLGDAMPLIVMLHGCKQGPDDFAVGTRMNAMAERHGFLVAYPCQTYRSNGANCWNWYEAGEQRRGGQEPSLIAGIVTAIGRRWAVQHDRVFVAGLSAGASMAVIMGQTYPELFAGVAAHSGLPRGAAQDMRGAFAAMRGGCSAKGRLPYARTGKPVRTLVLHGDADRTVEVVNGCAITRQVVAAFRQAKRPLLARETSAAATSAATSITDYVQASGRVMVRECIVPGGSHAWFGGSPEGSFTDAAALDASAEVVRFFLRDGSAG